MIIIIIIIIMMIIIIIINIIIIVITLSISILAQFIATVLREQSVYFLLGVRGGFWDGSHGFQGVRNGDQSLPIAT